MDDKPPQGDSRFKLPSWLNWFPLQLLILVFVIPIIFIAKGAAWLFFLVAVVLFFWGMSQLAVSESVPLRVRTRLAWLLPAIQTVRQFARKLFYGTLSALERLQKSESAATKTETTPSSTQLETARNRVSPSLGFEILTLLIAIAAVVIGAIFIYTNPPLGILIVLAAVLVLSRLPILRKEYIVQEWSTLVSSAAALSEIFLANIAKEYQAYAIPDISTERKLVSPSFWSFIAAEIMIKEIRRPFCIVSLRSWGLKPYRIYFGAHPYGTTLHLVCYVTMEVGLLRRLWAIIPFLGRLAKVSVLPGGFVEPMLNVFERQDLTAYATIGNHIWKSTVDALVLSLSQLPKEQKIHAKGFLGIEE